MTQVTEVAITEQGSAILFVRKAGWRVAQASLRLYI